jgi:hypothetical protein
MHALAAVVDGACRAHDAFVRQSGGFVVLCVSDNGAPRGLSPVLIANPSAFAAFVPGFAGSVASSL